jgi:hypothetical protein
MGNKSKAVATAENKALAPVYDYGDDAGAGFEGTKSTDLAIPFLNVMQSNSPSVADGVNKNGDIVNSVTGEVWSGDEGIPFQAVHRERKFVKWKPRDQGGGLIAVYDPEDPYVEKVKSMNASTYGKLKTEDGNELIETHYVYGLILNNEGTEQNGFALMAFTSTKITPWKKWFTAMNLVKGKPPIFAFRARMTTTNEKNDKGQAYKGVDFKPLIGKTWVDTLIPPTDPMMLEAKNLRDMILSGIAKADFSAQERGPEGDAAGKTGGEKEVPF